MIGNLLHKTILEILWFSIDEIASFVQSVSQHGIQFLEAGAELPVFLSIHNIFLELIQETGGISQDKGAPDTDLILLASVCCLTDPVSVTPSGITESRSALHK